MADKFYGVARGAQLPVHVTEAGTTTSAAIELRVNDAVYPYKGDVIRGVQAILDYLVTKETTPIA